MTRILLQGLFLLSLVCVSSLKAQEVSNYWVLFADKENTPYSLDAPEEYLSIKAIERRQNQGITIDAKDLPIDPSYVNDLLNIDGVTYRYSSKWFNAVAVFCDDQTIDQILLLPFVSHVKSCPTWTFESDGEPKPVEQDVLQSGQYRLPIDYGLSANQIEDLNGQVLHDSGFEGAGIVMAILDSGFDNVDNMSSFTHLFEEDRILSTHDFVEGDEEVYDEHSHGRFVLSCIAGIKEGEAYGTATQASFHLLRTEDVDSETRVEEYNWIAGAEYADSVGADVLNTSLGYTTFDTEEESYSYADMDGNTTWISQGADIAASRGMLVINSAGNSGNQDWHFIGAPADGDSVLAIGSINADSAHTGFSSFGPTFDGRVKPNVCAQGQAAIAINEFDEVVAINGTSFSSPILAGLAACLWQSNPTATNMEVFRAIEMSAHLYLNPNDSLGYGIPDFGAAQLLLNEMTSSISENEPVNVLVFPNPFEDEVYVQLTENSGFKGLSLFDLRGREIAIDVQSLGQRSRIIPLTHLVDGVYILRVETEDSTSSIRITKR